MSTFLDDLYKASGIEKKAIGVFKPFASYDAGTDSLIYLIEDCSYRADRVSMFVTLLWHPYKEELVGIELKGFKVLFKTLKDFTELGEDDFLPLIKFIEAAILASISEDLLVEIGDDRKKEKLERARQFAKDNNATVSKQELSLAA